MKKFAILLALSMIASSAFAIMDDGPSSLGVYFDNAGNVNCFTPAMYQPYNMYFIVANPIVANMGGFEFAWRFAPAASPVVMSTTLPPQALNIGTNYNFIVGLGGGLITSEATVLVTLNLMNVAPMDPVTFVQVGPATPASIPLRAAYNNFANPAQIVPLNFATVDGVDVIIDAAGWAIPGVAKMSCPGPVATDSETWSGVKALFQ